MNIHKLCAPLEDYILYATHARCQIHEGVIFLQHTYNLLKAIAAQLPPHDCLVLLVVRDQVTD